jgi:hypothetical protein
MSLHGSQNVPAALTTNLNTLWITVAEITNDDSLLSRMHVRNTPRTSIDTLAASDAFFFVNKNRGGLLAHRKSLSWA